MLLINNSALMSLSYTQKDVKDINVGRNPDTLLC
jgi:hypothetical protein